MIGGSESYHDYHLYHARCHHLSGLIQGMGLAIIFIPLSAATFATLSPALRGQGRAFYSLVRNVGISPVQVLLVRNTQIARLNRHKHYVFEYGVD
jgi:hypothetical protein